MMIASMTEVENFLNKNICRYLIDFFDNYDKSKLHIHNKRYRIYLKHHLDDPTIKNVFSLYSKLRPFEYVQNMELIKWPVGEYHLYHIDNGYEKEIYNYDTTSVTNLNDNFKGGHTWVQNYEVVPQTGKLVIFNSWREHKADELLQNERYVILTWYRKRKG